MNFYYGNDLENFCLEDDTKIIGILTKNSEFDVNANQVGSWKYQIKYLKNILKNYSGKIYFEYNIPRIGKRIDIVIIINGVIITVEFKISDKSFNQSDKDQALGYGVELKNFHKESHDKKIYTLLFVDNEDNVDENNNAEFIEDFYEDLVSKLILCNKKNFEFIIQHISQNNNLFINSEVWEKSTYLPSPTTIEAAQAMYENHNIKEITQHESAENLSVTSEEAINEIKNSFVKNEKIICLINGVPGAGKTLAGLNIVNHFNNLQNNFKSVYLSGNLPLVTVLREALARDRSKRNNQKIIETRMNVKQMIQPIHAFRKDHLPPRNTPPTEKIIIFDEAQRCWDQAHMDNYLSKNGENKLGMSEPEFLISVADRHDYSCIVCLIGNGQEINTGEVGIEEWVRIVQKKYPHWKIVASNIINSFLESNHPNKKINEKLELRTSIRSFRSSKVAALIEAILTIDLNKAHNIFYEIYNKYPIKITRDITKAKEWIKFNTRGYERSGIVVSKYAKRLRHFGVHVPSNDDKDVESWFLNDSDDIRSSNFLEIASTEFDIQGLELDWVLCCWDGDLYYDGNNWIRRTFSGTKWNKINSDLISKYRINAYRVLLTRARQGMIIFVPEGDINDKTRLPEFYDGTYNLLKKIGFKEI